MTLDLALDPQLEAFIAAKIREGRYASASEVVRDALRLLQEEEALRGMDQSVLRDLAEAGMASGVVEEDGEAVLDRLEARYRGMLSAKDR